MLKKTKHEHVICQLPNKLKLNWIEKNLGFLPPVLGLFCPPSGSFTSFPCLSVWCSLQCLCSQSAVAKVHMYMQVCVLLLSLSHTHTDTYIISHLSVNELSGVKFKCVVECESYFSSLPTTAQSEKPPTCEAFSVYRCGS